MRFSAEELKGIRILDLTQVMAGPYCTKMLSDLGAEVIKVEPPSGDVSRKYPPFVKDESLYFKSLNDGKETLTLDLKCDEGKASLRNLIKESDVIIENFKNGVMEKLGFSQDEVLSINPNIIFYRISGFGKYEDRPFFDLLAQAELGLIDHNEKKLPVPVADLFTGLYAAIGILSKLLSKKNGAVHLSMTEVLLHSLTYKTANILNDGNEKIAKDSSHPYRVLSNVFEFKGGSIAIHASSEKHFSLLCKSLDVEHLTKDPLFCTSDSRLENRELVDQYFQRLCKNIKIDYALKAFEEVGIPHAKVNSFNQDVKELANKYCEVLTDENGIHYLKSPLVNMGELSEM